MNAHAIAPGVPSDYYEDVLQHVAEGEIEDSLGELRPVLADDGALLVLSAQRNAGSRGRVAVSRSETTCSPSPLLSDAMWVRRRRDGGDVAILLYHRLGKDGGDPLGLNVPPRTMEEHLRAVSERFAIVPLAEVTEQPRTLRDRPAVIITFDDGYSGVFDHAKPLFERLGIPATAFIPSGFIGGKREFWWEELEGLVLHDRTLPPSLELTVGGMTVHWSASDRSRRLRGRRPTPRIRLYVALARLLPRVTTGERLRVLAEVSSWSGVEAPHRRDRMAMTADEVRALGSGGAIEIGAHTVSHPVLAALSAAEQTREIAESKTTLETMIGRGVTSFAYPYGGKNDYTSASVNAVRAARFERACANIQGPVEPDSDSFELPRFILRDWDPATLLQRLDRLFARRAALRRNAV